MTAVTATTTRRRPVFVAQTTAVMRTCLAGFVLLAPASVVRAQVVEPSPRPVVLPATEQSRRHDVTAQFLSREGNLAYLGLGVALPLLTDGRDGTNHSLRALDALGTSAVLSASLKALTREKRPDTDERNSFPSGHATAAFAVATVESHFHPRQAVFWYAGAALIADSRVRLHRHHTHDVLAGAALGYLTARWELARPRGLILSPVLRSERDRGFSVQFGGRF